MSDAFDSDRTNLAARVLRQAMERLASLRLVDGDASRVEAALSRFILEELHNGETDEGRLVQRAVDRHKSSIGHEGP